ncbi:hypothetical protein M5K25_008737 [Dendrobium thyrsiflorum]|uniref:beta-N-acetylhexosaminidase n=1 Tax=Dendrobium thyrsiflorum TaxID=117978 RepID=A0ABD0VGL8_DENTH
MKLKHKNTEETKLIKNKKLRKVRSIMKSMKKRLVKIGKRALKRDPILKRLGEAVQKLDKVSADVTPFFLLLNSMRQEQKEQEVDFYKARETGSLPTTNDLIGRGEAKEFVTQWLKKLSNEHQDRNISLLSIVGHGGMGKTTLLQHIYEDEMTKEFDLKMWVCVSNNFDPKEVIADMLELLKKKRPRLEKLEALQGHLKNEVMSKRFLLVLDDVWEEEEEEERDKSKWENVLAPLTSGGFGSKILVTTRTDSIALMFAKVIRKKKEPLRLEGLEEEECLELLNTHAFADVDNLDDQRKLKLITAEIAKKLSGSPLAAKVIGDEMTKEFDLKMWVCVSNNFDPKEVIADMLELLKKERPRLEKLEALQWSLKNEVMSKRFLLVLDDVWEEEEERDKSKWENVLAPLASGGFGSKILVTTRTDSIALMFAKVITKKKEIIKLEGLEEDECLQLLYSHAFAGVENPPDDHKKLRAIAGEIVKKLLGSPLAAKVIGGVLNSLDLDERRWRTVLENNLLGQNSINSILRLSYIVLPNHLQNCFAFSCLFPQDHEFDRDDLVRMWIALGFIQPCQGMTMEDIGGRYFDVLVKKTLFDKGLDSNRQVASEVYEPSSNSWSAVKDGMVICWCNPSISMNGRLYSSDCRDGCKLRVYDDATDSWRRFMDSKLHLGSSQSLEAAAFVSLNGKLVVIRNNMSISLVDVSNPRMSFETNSAHLWETISGKGQLKTFMSNLWSSLAGRTGIKSHIVHCQLTWSADSQILVAAGINISDRPLFPHRGLLLDTARNFFTVEDIMRTVRAMSYNKMNVLHWHITDSQSFPILLPSVPHLAIKGSYGPEMRYSPEDVRRIVDYAMSYGVRVMPEIDVPGHSGSWAEAYPELVTCANQFWRPPNKPALAAEPATGQLNPLNPKTYRIVNNVFRDAANLFPEPFFHAGADEVNSACWESDPSIAAFISAGGTLDQLLQTFITKTHPFLTSHLNRTAVYWKTSSSDPPSRSHLLPSPKKPPSCKPGTTARTTRRSSRRWGIESSSLPGISTTWIAAMEDGSRVYDYDITEGLTEEERRMVIGGEVAMWSEQVDGVVADGRIWPRTAAMAEALWSGNRGEDGQKRYGDATDRLNEWRHRMVGRGIAAEPIQPLWCARNPGICSALIASIVSAMEGFFVGPIMEKIINTCSDYLKDQFRWQTGMKEELERLRENHPKIQAVVSVANQAQLNDKNGDLNKWIWQLRDAIDEAVDVLDDFEYAKHKEQLTKNREETKKRKLKSFLLEIPRKLVKIGERGLKRDPNLKRLEEAVQKLDKVSADVTIFLHILDSAKQEQKEQEVDFYRTRETGSLPKNDLIGRGKHKESVVQWLRKPSNEHRGTDLYRNISLLSIVGHGGMGKTTLLQHIYEDEMTKEFDLKMWVCVSNNFDPKEVIADMLELLKKKRPRLEKLEALQGHLKNEVMSKRFLLVLDDVWEEEEERDKSKWENVLAPLASGGFDSKILVTTRTDSIALMFAKVITKKKEIVKLEGLEEDECLQLLNSHAFAGVENSPDDHKKLRAIAGEIVKKLLGSPLAAKVIGGVLNSLDLDERRWRTVLESNLLGQNSINSILRLSYIVLPNHLQNCFAFSCLFPQDHEFDRDDLVRMWIALGFIQPSQGMTMEDIGGKYFDVLVKKTLFDKVRGHYKMHDLIHESASNFFAQECGKLVDDEESSVKISETIRHLSIQTTNSDIIKKIGQFKYLHSLILFYKTSNQDLCNALFEIFKESRSLRLLYVSVPRFEMIPEEIENLMHLRYLKFTFWGSTMLPRSLSNIYHLQYIIFDWLGGPWEVKFDDSLPSDINNLSNLRYVKLPGNFISSIYGIGKLKSLQELNMFDFRDVSGYRIGELENMNDLCILEINCLENVKDAEEVRSAKLCEKRRLTDLILRWRWRPTDSRNTDLNENVLDNLQPSKCLRNLGIERYMGTRSAIWMNNVSSIFNLEKINLTDCMEWETLPPFGQLPFLKSLTLSNMPKVKWLENKFNGNDKYRAFPLLEVLDISGLEALVDWFEAGVAAEDGCLFPCLIELFLVDCPKLKELPSLPSKLKRLRISEIGWTTLNFCSNSNPLNPLESLWVIQCPNITSLPLADEISRLAALRYLRIIDCPNLISLGRYREVETTNNCHLMLSDLSISDPLVLLMEPLRSIASLKKLRIEDNDELVSFPNEAEQWFLKVRPSLSELQFGSLKSLESLPSSLESLSSLQKVYIMGVPMLRELPNLPPSLESLTIRLCHSEFEERYREDGGSDRHKIAHIPHIQLLQ